MNARILVVACVLAVCAPAHAALPVVLVPGFMGQRQSGVLFSYFPTLKRALAAAGADVTEVAPPPLADSDARGRFLVREIEAACARTGAAKVVVIAHSQGGVDVRAAFAQGGAARIAAVATLATPHHGTGVADTALGWPMPAVRTVLSLAAAAWQIAQGDDVATPDADGALAGLSTRGMARFARNHDVARDGRVAGVPFFSVAGVSGGRARGGACDGGAWGPPTVVDRMHPLLAVGSAMIKAALGDVSNDGVVPTSSMRFGRFLGCVPADHVDWEGWDEWRGPFDAPAFTVELWRGLEDVAAANDVHAMDAHVSRLAALAYSRPVDDRP